MATDEGALNGDMMLKLHGRPRLDVNFRFRASKNFRVLPTLSATTSWGSATIPRYFGDGGSVTNPSEPLS
jgi:hypothetical protein